MKRNMKFNLAIYAILVLVIGPGLVVLVGAFGDKLARWGGYADSLAPVSLLVLFVVGSLVLTPRRH